MNKIKFVDLNNYKLDILRKISDKPEIKQRQLAVELKISLGKINYVLKELRKKGLVKVNNFKNNPNKTSYLYLLTAKGVSEKTKITIKFMKRKFEEYQELKKELNDINK